MENKTMPNKFKVGDVVVGNKLHISRKRHGMSGKIASEGNGGYFVLWASEVEPLLAFARELYKSPRFKVGEEHEEQLDKEYKEEFGVTYSQHLEIGRLTREISTYVSIEDKRKRLFYLRSLLKKE
jgi:hypothetical protein